MNSTSHKDAPHKWAEVIKAWADGKTIEYRATDREEWQTYTQTGSFGPWKCLDYYEWRIKPERWYRVALLRDSISEWTTTAGSAAEEGNIEGFQFFKGWLTDRIYY